MEMGTKVKVFETVFLRRCFVKSAKLGRVTKIRIAKTFRKIVSILKRK